MTLPRYLPAEDQAAIGWEHARQLGQFTAHELAARSKLRLEVLRPALRAWCHAGMLTYLPVGQRRRFVYRVAETPVVVERPASTPAEAMWRTAQVLTRTGGQFSPVDLVMHAATEATAVSEDDARQFCAMLMRGGYLRVIRKAIPGRLPASYRLIRDTGPRPPEERRVRAIWDPNTRRWVHVPEPSA
jgi:hypothetical protein